MKILLDTHILLWALTADRKLSAEAAKLLKDTNNEVLVSSVSLWEISIKHALGRLSLSPIEITEAIHKTGFCPLPITFEHCTRLSDLPPVHNDPFDRMLVAQSLSEPAILVTQERLLRDYGNTVLLV
jgi:PIN domain nuclease of toxin-antitoxin system